MTSKELRQKFLNFFEKNGHKIIFPASLIPENDPTVLFTAAGMHPLVPFLMGEKHPRGKRLADVQPCVRTDDIDEVGDKVHHTFFEMLGNWSLGDYFKEEAIKWSFEFLTSRDYLGIDKKELAVSIFEGDADAPQDLESKRIWLNLGISEKRIKALGKKDNWWGPAGQTGPCGPDTEMFYWSGGEPAPDEFNPEDDRWVEIWNDVFMEYYKKEDGKYGPLTQKNVDTGMGLERVLAVLNGLDDNYWTELFLPIVKKIEELSGKKYAGNEKAFRIIADHAKAAVFIIMAGEHPSNKERGYVLRRLIRRAVIQSRKLGIKKGSLGEVAKPVFGIYKKVDWYDRGDEETILQELSNEEMRFEETLEKGMEEAKNIPENVTGEWLFYLFQSFGFPAELSIEEIKNQRENISESEVERLKKEFQEAFKKHQELSRSASVGMFKGGLADAGEKAVKYHTATHLLLSAMREILGPEIYQKGSNITAERLRFDFNYPQRLSEEQIKKIEYLVNEKIKEDIEVKMLEMPKAEALKIAKVSFDPAKYGEIVKVYKIGDFSIELCGGPHVQRTGELGHFKITKEESSGAGIRRIRATLE